MYAMSDVQVVIMCHDRFGWLQKRAAAAEEGKSSVCSVEERMSAARQRVDQVYSRELPARVAAHLAQGLPTADVSATDNTRLNH